MTTYRIGLPSVLKRGLEQELPHRDGAMLGVRVTPRDRAERRCAAYDADHYEVQAYYTRTDHDALDLLEKAIAELPGVYLTTQVVSERDRNAVTNPEWPVPLGISRRGFHDLRPQVLALISD
jgi:hypothetical protein